MINDTKSKIEKAINRLAHNKGDICGIKKYPLDYLILTKLCYILTNSLVKNICYFIIKRFKRPMLTFQPFNLIYELFLIQLIKIFDGTLSIEIGINLWLAPQISEHCPKNRPGRLVKKLTWFNRPGTASTFTPRAGTVQEWRTSAAVINVRIWVLIGTTVRLSTSNKRKFFSSISLEGII